MLGLYISGHPLDEYERAISTLTSMDSAAFAPPPESDDEGLHPPALTDTRPRGHGRHAGRTQEQDDPQQRADELSHPRRPAGIFEVIVFPRVLGDCQALLGDGTVLLVGGRLSIREDDQPKLIAEQIAVLEPGMRQLPPGFELRRVAARSPARGR
jgi:DNA polymerase-3 subunit alpha